LIPPGNSGSLSSTALLTIVFPASTGVTLSVPAPEEVVGFIPTVAVPSLFVFVTAVLSVFFAIFWLACWACTISGLTSWSLLMWTSVFCAFTSGSIGFFIWACPSGPGYPLQVLACSFLTAVGFPLLSLTQIL